IPARSGSATRRRSRSSPMSNSRRASRPTTKKKKVIRPPLTQSRRSWATPTPPIRIESWVRHTCSYECASTFTHASAASVAASRTTALPISVRRNSRSGVSRFRTHAVRPVNAETLLMIYLRTQSSMKLLPDTLRLGAAHLTVTSLDRALPFYGGALGLRLHWRDGDSAGLGAGAEDLIVLTEHP